MVRTRYILTYPPNQKQTHGTSYSNFMENSLELLEYVRIAG